MMNHYFRKFIYHKELLLSKVFSSSCPIYHYHIRKTAGTSINFSFLRTVSNDVHNLYYELSKKENHQLIKKGKVVVGWNKHLIDKEHYFYAFSHIPSHKLTVSDKVTTLTCFRSPYDRLISHFNMLRYFQKNNINHPCMKVEGKWINNGIVGFINSMTKDHLMAQLYMFSSTYNIDEAINFLGEKKVIILFTEKLIDDIIKLGKIISLELSLGREKSFGYKEKVTSYEEDYILEKLQQEIDFIEIVKKDLYE